MFWVERASTNFYFEWFQFTSPSFFYKSFKTCITYLSRAIAFLTYIVLNFVRRLINYFSILHLVKKNATMGKKSLKHFFPLRLCIFVIYFKDICNSLFYFLTSLSNLSNLCVIFVFVDCLFSFKLQFFWFLV